MITDDKKWHYFSVINLLALFKEKLSNRKGDLYCLNCFNSYTSENKLKEHHIERPKQAEKILKYIPGEKSLKTTFTMYLDLECLLKKEQSCQNNPKKSYTEEKAIHEPFGWAMLTSCSFDEK